MIPYINLANHPLGSKLAMFSGSFAPIDSYYKNPEKISKTVANRQVSSILLHINKSSYATQSYVMFFSYTFCLLDLNVISDVKLIHFRDLV